jgi:ABC-2 type transport system ATP-binding protein
VKAVITDGLTKLYDGFPAAQDVSIEVEAGTIHGLVGPNGAGKTTMIKMLTCLIQPTSGSATVNGLSITREPTAVKATLGYLAENSHLYEDMSVESYLGFFAEIYGLSRKAADGRIADLLGGLQVADRAQSQIGGLSKGLKRRVAIARALLHDPPLLILDEVASGLDPLSARELRDYLRLQRSKGKTVLLSTHNLYEAEQLCDKVTIMHKGRAIATGTVEELRQRYLPASGPGTPLETVFFEAIGKGSSPEF